MQSTDICIHLYCITAWLFTCSRKKVLAIGLLATLTSANSFEPLMKKFWILAALLMMIIDAPNYKLNGYRMCSALLDVNRISLHSNNS